MIRPSPDPVQHGGGPAGVLQRPLNDPLKKHFIHGIGTGKRRQDTPFPQPEQGLQIGVLVSPGGPGDIPSRLGEGRRVEDDEIVGFLRLPEIRKTSARTTGWSSVEMPLAARFSRARPQASSETSTETTRFAPPRPQATENPPVKENPLKTIAPAHSPPRSARFSR